MKKRGRRSNAEKAAMKAAKVGEVMREYKEGELTSHGKKVTDRKQAIAIALSEAEKFKYESGGSIEDRKKDLIEKWIKPFNWGKVTENSGVVKTMAAKYDLGTVTVAALFNEHSKKGYVPKHETGGEIEERKKQFIDKWIEPFDWIKVNPNTLVVSSMAKVYDLDKDEIVKLINDKSEKSSKNENYPLLVDFSDDEDIQGADIQKDAFEIIDWKYDQIWSDEKTLPDTQKKYDKKVFDFERKYGVLLQKKYSKTSFETGGEIESKIAKLQKVVDSSLVPDSIKDKARKEIESLKAEQKQEPKKEEVTPAPKTVNKKTPEKKPKTSSMKMYVKLSSSVNPDRDRNEDGNVSIKPYKVEVSSMKEAREKVLDFIEKHNLGGGNWTGGQIYEGTKQIAHVSYNGRVWEGSDAMSIAKKEIILEKTPKTPEKKESKFKVGDYVSYESGDTNKEQWFGKITKVLDFGKEYAYRLNAFSLINGVVRNETEKTNEVYESELSAVDNKEYLKLNKEFNKKTPEKKEAPAKKSKAKPSNAPRPGQKRDLKKDSQRKALPLGKRISKNGNVYYENRLNEADSDSETKLEKGGEILSKENLEFRKLPEETGGYYASYKLGTIYLDEKSKNVSYKTSQNNIYNAKSIRDAKSKIDKYTKEKDTFENGGEIEKTETKKSGWGLSYLSNW